MKIVIIGQSLFGAEVYKLLKKNGYEIVGIFTVPDKSNRADPLAEAAQLDNVPCFKVARWRVKNQIVPEVFEQYKSLDADLNILPYCTQFIPMEVINFPKLKSICYHPSILPLHRGASAINWTLIHGDEKAGFTVFWPDDGLDTGPILLQKSCDVDPNDTVDSLYQRFMMPEGIKAMLESVDLIKKGEAPKLEQDSELATYESYISTKPALAEINFDKTAEKIHNFIRGCDKAPGAWTTIDEQKVIFYGSSIWNGPKPDGDALVAPKAPIAPIVHSDGILLTGKDGKFVNVKQVLLENGKMMLASKFGRKSFEEKIDIELNDAELKMEADVECMWKGILKLDEIEKTTDFFKCGAGSLDVTRLLEEVKHNMGVELSNEDVYMNPTLEDFVRTLILKHRDDSANGKACGVKYEKVEMNVNGLNLIFPKQMFVNGQFMDSCSGRTYPTINPADESVICNVSKASKQDVDHAVIAAKIAFEEGEWGKMNARDRGRLMYKLADLMDQHKEELATLESIDSGAVYTLALKTHVGMSIDAWRYFAGWCDKIQGSTIPINHARPNRNLTITKKEPLGVCGLITPWNYPLMMLSWKMAACLAAGNTVVHKPAQVCPLTALKFAELTIKAGFPKGVVNILPGSGTEVGQAITDHPFIRSVGFTGSTNIGAELMKSCALSNIKKCSLELGGKSPLIIFADCDMDKAVRQAISSVFFNKGENCIAAGRLFVAESIHDEFLKRVVSEVKKFVIGDPLDRSTHHGPQNHRAHLEKLVEFCQKGVKEGAILVLGGKQLDKPGLYFEPTIFTDVKDDSYLATEESFGPIMNISKFNDNDVDGVLRRANKTEYGLASGVFSNDINKVLKVAEKLDAGTVFVNCYNKTDVAAPFGGFKQSGFGKDLGEEALNQYLKIKTITIEY